MAKKGSKPKEQTGKDQLINILEVEGVNYLGFGMIAQAVMRDATLSRDARWLYAYFCSFAGAGSSAFPSRATIINEGKMGKNTFYKCMDELEKRDLIRVRQNTANTGKFANNIYTLVSNPCPRRKDTVKRPAKKPTVSPQEGHGPCPHSKDTKSINVLKEVINTNVLITDNNIDSEKIKSLPKLSKTNSQKDLEMTLLSPMYLAIKGSQKLTVTEDRRIRALLNKATYELIEFGIQHITPYKPKYPMVYLERTIYNWLLKDLVSPELVLLSIERYKEEQNKKRLKVALETGRGESINPNDYYNWMDEV